jgi:hypothetical protein
VSRFSTGSGSPSGSTLDSGFQEISVGAENCRQAAHTADHRYHGGFWPLVSGCP